MRDYEALLETANRLRDLKDLEFHVVSPPEDFFPKDDRIMVHRSVSDRDLLHLYRTSHLLFLPLKNATANTFLLEGAACGLPVLSTDRPSTRAYFPGDGAVLIPGNDPAAFADTIRFLYDNPGKRNAMSLAVRRRAKELGWNRVVEEYVTLYGEVVRNQRENRCLQ